MTTTDFSRFINPYMEDHTIYTISHIMGGKLQQTIDLKSTEQSKQQIAPTYVGTMRVWMDWYRYTNSLDSMEELEKYSTFYKIPGGYLIVCSIHYCSGEFCFDEEGLLHADNGPALHLFGVDEFTLFYMEHGKFKDMGQHFNYFNWDDDLEDRFYYCSGSICCGLPTSKQLDQCKEATFTAPGTITDGWYFTRIEEDTFTVLHDASGEPVTV